MRKSSHMDKPHPIALAQVFFSRMVVLAIPEHESLEDGKANILPTNSIHVQMIEGIPGRWVATMRTILNPDRDPIDPYFIDMECVGAFDVSEELPYDEAHRAVTITAHNVLYGAIRESVSWLTGRSAHGPFMLGLSILKPKTSEEKEQSRPSAESTKKATRKKTPNS